MLANTGDDAHNHLILIVDKSAQRIPWESLPILRGEAVSRLPSINFLRDFLNRYSDQDAGAGAAASISQTCKSMSTTCKPGAGNPVRDTPAGLARASGYRSSVQASIRRPLVDKKMTEKPTEKPCPSRLGFVVNPESTFYILNPAGDLQNTQKEFEADFSNQSSWKGIVGRAPTEDEYQHALEQHELLMYGFE